MVESFLTTEGDRSSVDTPDNKEKARRQVMAATASLRILTELWGTMSKVERATAIAQTRDMLNTAQHHNFRGGE